jgi:hypothetical protein
VVRDEVESVDVVHEEVECVEAADVAEDIEEERDGEGEADAELDDGMVMSSVCGPVVRRIQWLSIGRGS